MASGKEISELNYLHLNMLVVELGTECIKKLFDLNVPQNELEAELKKNWNRINKDAQISHTQKRLLNPNNGNPSSSDYDITLLVKLAGHLFLKNDSKILKKGDNTDISATDYSDAAEFVRVRNIRNWINHMPKASVEEAAFNDKWKELSDVLIRLGHRCNQYDIKQRIEDMKAKTIEYFVSSEVKSLRDQSTKCLEDFRKYKLRTNVETEKYQKAAKILEDHHVVILTGSPGEGKTEAAMKLALSNSEPRNCALLKEPQDWRRVDWSLKLFDTVIVDDIFGAGSLNHNVLYAWKPYLSEIEDEAKRKSMRVIITSRHYILEESKKEIQDANVALFKDSREKENVIICLETKGLSENELSEILKAQANRNSKKLSESLIKECVSAAFHQPRPDRKDNKRSKFAFGFPECANMFVRSTDIMKNGSKFFEEPAPMFKKYLQELKSEDPKNKDKFLALVAVWDSHTGHVSKKDVTNVAIASDTIKEVIKDYAGELDRNVLEHIKASLQSHVGDFLDFNKRTGEYGFSHRLIGDMVGVVFGQENHSIAIKHCRRDFLMEHVCLDEDDVEKEYMIVVEEWQYDELARKFINMILRRNCNNESPRMQGEEFQSLIRTGSRSNKVNVSNKLDFGIISHRAFDNKDFVNVFIETALTDGMSSELFSEPVMRMTGYFLDYGITMKKMEMCLTGYALYSGRSVLGLAVLHRNILDASNMDPTLSILLATHRSDVETMKALLARGAKVSGDALYVAAHKKEDMEPLEVLIDHPGVNINDKGNIMNGNCPLIVACRKNKGKVVECLLKHGADHSIKNERNLTALHKAVIYNNVDIVTSLLRFDAHLDVKGGKFKRTPLHIAADKGLDDIVELLLKKGASVRVRDHRRHYPIHLAAIRGKTNVVRLLLQHDMTQDKLRIASYGTKSLIKGMSLFHVAIWKRNEQLLSVLINLNADANVRDFFGQSPLMYAITQGRKTIANKLLTVPSVDKDMPNKQGFTPLHAAIHKGFTKIAMLIASESNSNMKDKYGRAPLHVACEKSNLTMVQNLLKRWKANPRQITKRGDTVFHILQRKDPRDAQTPRRREAIEQLFDSVDSDLRTDLSNTPNIKGVLIKGNKRHAVGYPKVSGFQTTSKTDDDDNEPGSEGDDFKSDNSSAAATSQDYSDDDYDIDVYDSDNSERSDSNCGISSVSCAGIDSDDDDCNDSSDGDDDDDDDGW